LHSDIKAARVIRVVLASLLATAALGCAAQAETIQIMALGASNTYAQAVSASQAWPAKLESMLRAKGYDVNVTVKGVTLGDASSIAAAASAIPSGTRVVVYDTGGGNSRERGIDPHAMRPQIEREIRAHGAKPVFAAYNAIVGPEKGGGNPNWIQGDAHHHITAAAHTRVAAALLPKVIAAIGKK
jgi:acyl-CoA thioesterase-1